MHYEKHSARSKCGNLLLACVPARISCTWSDTSNLWGTETKDTGKGSVVAAEKRQDGTILEVDRLRLKHDQVESS